jgi:hypothetical protein
MGALAVDCYRNLLIRAVTEQRASREMSCCGFSSLIDLRVNGNRLRHCYFSFFWMAYRLYGGRSQKTSCHRRLKTSYNEFR